MTRGMGFTSNILLSPVFPSPDVVIVTPVWNVVMVTLPVQMPIENPPVVVGLIVPVVSLNELVPV